jgi:ribosome biogenesis SPOUT family RNA methylase Rps3
MTTYIIEHLEPQVWRWCLIEYEHISNIVGKENLWITNVKRKNAKLEQFAKIFKQSVKDLSLSNACVLDPEASSLLTPQDSKFEYFIFGGILGDHPPKKRTKKELTKFIPQFEKRHIGKKQFPTDNAVYVVKKILEGKKFEELEFKDFHEIHFDEFRSVELPFRYVLKEDGKPLISEKIVKYLKNKKKF